MSEVRLNEVEPARQRTLLVTVSELAPSTASRHESQPAWTLRYSECDWMKIAAVEYMDLPPYLLFCARVAIADVPCTWYHSSARDGLL